METKITFGKYKGKSIEYIYNIDKQYILWLCSQTWYKERHTGLYNASIKIMDNIKIEKYEDKFLVYTDGACPDNGTPKARSSIGIHFSEKNSIKLNDIGEKLILNNHSNNIAELLAIKKALELLISNNIKVPIQLYTDSSYCKSILDEWYNKWVKNNLLDNKKNLDIIKKTYDLYTEINNITIYYVKAHTNNNDEHSYGNRMADKLARNAIKS
jgi:ribonuclease HI|tara:strand:- start:4424 stop:5062 length:639 start_codon:yes stop_codon:yes gene_type:complete